MGCTIPPVCGWLGEGAAHYDKIRTRINSSIATNLFFSLMNIFGRAFILSVSRNSARSRGIMCRFVRPHPLATHVFQYLHGLISATTGMRSVLGDTNLPLYDEWIWGTASHFNCLVDYFISPRFQEAKTLFCKNAREVGDDTHPLLQTEGYLVTYWYETFGNSIRSKTTTVTCSTLGECEDRSHFLVYIFPRRNPRRTKIDPCMEPNPSHYRAPKREDFLFLPHPPFFLPIPHR